MTSIEENVYEITVGDSVYEVTVGGGIIDAGGAGGAGEINTASAAGTGASLFYQKSVYDLQFNSIKSENTLIDVSLDGVTHDIELTLQEGLIDHDSLTNTHNMTTDIANHVDVDANTTARHSHANQATLDATTASFLLADETKLDGIEYLAEVNNLSDVNAGLLVGGTSVGSLHFHSEDRARSNHTGTQVAATISNLAATIAAHADVAANTAARHNESFSKIIYIGIPDVADSFPVFSVGSGSYTITRITHKTEAGTVDWNLQERAEATPGTAGTKIYSSDEQSGTTSSTDTSFSNDNMAAYSQFFFDISAVSGSPTDLNIVVHYTKD